jgi:uncharacterized small protein (DUF1192 family)
MAMMDDDPFAPKPAANLLAAHRPLDQMGIGELEERIALLEAEIANCRSMISRKTSAKAAADAVFGGGGS